MQLYFRLDEILAASRYGGRKPVDGDIGSWQSAKGQKPIYLRCTVGSMLLSFPPFDR